jgi:hypothetical protein
MNHPSGRQNNLEGAAMSLKPFALEPGMLNIRGQFYPTGYLVMMFPGEQDARDAGRMLDEGGWDGEAAFLLTPEDIHQHIARTVGNADIPLPSAGTEGDTVRKFADLASQGHWGLMVKAPKGEHSDRVTELLKTAKISYAQLYRTLVIEDVVV